MSSMDFKELMQGKVDPVLRKYVLQRIEEAMKPIQQQLTEVAEDNVSLTGGDLGEIQKIIVDTFLNTQKPLYVTHEEEPPEYYVNVEMFLNSISQEIKEELFVSLLDSLIDTENEKGE